MPAFVSALRHSRKSVAGAVPLFIAAAFFLLDSDARRKLFRSPGFIFGVAVPALLIPAIYMLPHCLFTPGACDTIFGSEVATRIEEGYHNSDEFWFYFIRLFPDRQAIGPEVMIPELLWAAAAAFFRRSALHRFLLVWAIPPGRAVHRHSVPAYPVFRLHSPDSHHSRRSMCCCLKCASRTGLQIGGPEA